MTKKNIQVILAILALTLLSVGGLYYFSQQSKTPAPKAQKPVVAQPVEKVASLSEVSFDESETSAKIMLSEVAKKNYRVRLFDAGNGFSVLFPNTKMAVDGEYLNPHPWINSITFEEKPFRGKPSVEMTVSTLEGIALFDQYQDASLIIELQNTMANISSSSKDGKADSVAKSEPKAVTKPKPKPVVVKPKPKPKPKPTPAPEPEVNLDDDSFAFENPVDTPSGNDSAGIDDGFNIDDSNSFPVDTPEPDDSIALGDEFDDGGDMNVMDEGVSDLVEEELSIMDLETNLSLGDELGDDDSGSVEVASIPSDNGKFDMSAGGQISSVQSMQVSSTANGRTSVRFDREADIPYKIFRLKNPSRLVVDFKDARPGFDVASVGDTAGTTIDKVETREFESNDSKLLRVIMFLNKEAEYSSSKDGSSLIIDLP